jgi:hypothetical protein
VILWVILIPVVREEDRPVNREVNLTKRIRLSDGTTRFCTVLLAANGRVKPDYVLVDGKPEHHPEGRYYID